VPFGTRIIDVRWKREVVGKMERQQRGENMSIDENCDEEGGDWMETSLMASIRCKNIPMM